MRSRNVVIRLHKIILSVFLIPPSTCNFLSGVFTASAVNILTSQIPNSILMIGAKYIVAAVLFFVIAIQLSYLSTILIPLQKHMDDYDDKVRKKEGKIRCWYEVLVNQGARLKLSINWLALVLCIVGIAYCLFSK